MKLATEQRQDRYNAQCTGKFTLQCTKFLQYSFLIITYIFLSACYDTDPEPSEGFVSGTVIDAVSKLALSGVAISVTDTNNTRVTSTTTDSAGRFYVSLAADSLYDFLFTRDGHQPSKYVNVQVRGNEETVLEAILQIDVSITGVGSISGTITDAVTGLALSAATLRFRSGINVQGGAISAETATDISGNYSLLDTLSTGLYTCEVILDGYTTNYVTVLVLGGQLTDNQNSTATRPLSDGETRVVLTWGASPRDLDSHITGPFSDNSASRFHVYFGNKGNEIFTPFTILDLDDLNSYGPETITIKKQHQGIYRYSVHNYSNSTARTSSALASSGAKVTVYQGNADPRIFNVPSGVGTLWTVFTLNGGTLEPINSLTNNTGINILGLNIGHEQADDAALISSVPLK